MDYYSTLGLNRGASQEDIKKAYRSMAMKHHPDRGGDEKKFKEIEEAYRTLSDPQKKQMFDMGVDPNSQGGRGGFGYNQGPFEFHFGTDNMEDIFNRFHFGFGQRPLRKNRSLNIKVNVLLEDVLNGKEINAEVGIPGGQKKLINISIPPGIETGQQIKYEGMGDSSIPDLRPGDLIVNVIVKPHSIFSREGDNLVCERRISSWDAILGSTVDLETLDRKTINIAIPPGTQSETVLSCKGEGLPNLRTKKRGALLVKIKVMTPVNLTVDQLELVRKLKNGI
jgi:curved DNA-binding protein